MNDYRMKLAQDLSAALRLERNEAEAEAEARVRLRPVLIELASMSAGAAAAELTRRNVKPETCWSGPRCSLGNNPLTHRSDCYLGNSAGRKPVALS
jgi:hypothetical protein